jgi:hypothetical protein
MPDESLLSTNDTSEVSDAPAPVEAAAPAVESAPESAQQPEGENTETPEAGAPESYESFSLPEGYQVDESKVVEFQSWAKTNNLSQAAAQSAVDMFIQQKEQDAAAVEKAQGEWEDASKTDTEFGGNAFDVSIRTAVKTINKFGTPELTDFLNATGIGNHPEIIRIMYRVGQSISEDKIVMGSANATPRTAEKIMYPDMA